MKKHISLMLALVTVIGLVAGINFNSSAFSAQPIYFGEQISSSAISTTDDYYFNVPARGNVSINMVSVERGDVFNVHIFDANYNKLYDLTNEYTTDGAGRHIRKCSILFPKGRYYFRIEDPFGFGRCDYSLLINYSPQISAPQGLRCVARNSSAQKIAWKKVAGVNGYQVQRSNNGGTKWSSSYYTKGLSFVFKNLTAGGKYKFRVRSYKNVSGTRYYGKWSKTLCSCCTPAKPVLKSVSSPKHTKIKTTWAKAGGTKSGYQILYGRNAKFTSIAARKNVSGKYTSYIGKNFTKGRTYYVKVRTYTTFNGKAYYSGWSAAKKVKCK